MKGWEVDVRSRQRNWPPESVARRARLVGRIKLKPASEKDTEKGKEGDKVGKGELVQGLGHDNNFAFNAKSNKNHRRMLSLRVTIGFTFLKLTLATIQRI